MNHFQCMFQSAEGLTGCSFYSWPIGGGEDNYSETFRIWQWRQRKEASGVGTNMAMVLRGSTKWLFTREQIESTPSRRSGIEPDRELSYRQQAANLIQDMGQRLNVYPFSWSPTGPSSHYWARFSPNVRLLLNADQPSIALSDPERSTVWYLSQFHSRNASLGQIRYTVWYKGGEAKLARATAYFFPTCISGNVAPRTGEDS